MPTDPDSSQTWNHLEVCLHSELSLCLDRREILAGKMKCMGEHSYHLSLGNLCHLQVQFFQLSRPKHAVSYRVPTDEWKMEARH
jgi:hypothetical protein